MASLIKRLIILSSTISLYITGCAGSDQFGQRKSKEKPEITEKAEEPSIDPQSLSYLFEADNLSQSIKYPEYDRAIGLYTKAIEADPQNACAYEGRANSQESLEQYDLAIADLTKAIETDPQNISAYQNRASIYNRYLDEDNKAVADMSKAIALTIQDESESLDDKSESLIESQYFRFCQPSNLYFLYQRRSFMFLGLEQFDRAIDDADMLVALNPNDAASYHFLAGMYRYVEQHKNAIANEDRAIAISPSYAHAYRGRAYSYGQLKQYDKAIADYTKAISFYSDYLSRAYYYADAYLGRADIYRQLKQYDLAIADYDKVLLGDYTKNADAYKSRGELYKELGEISKAKQDLSQAASLFEEQENIEEYQIVQQQLQQL